MLGVVVGTLALDRLVVRALDLDLEEAGFRLVVVAAADLEARARALDVVAKTAQARGVEVDALVGEAAPLVDLQRPVASGEALHGGGRHLIGNDVLRVHPAA